MTEELSAEARQALTDLAEKYPDLREDVEALPEPVRSIANFVFISAR